MISNMESQLKQQGAGDRVKEVLDRGAQSPQGRGLSAAGHALQPDRRHPGGVQRADGPLQGAHRRVRRPDAGLLRRDDRPAEPDVIEAAAKHAKKEPITEPAGRSAQARMGRAARPGAGAQGMQRHRRGCPHLTPCSPRWPRSFSPTRAEGPKNVGKNPPSRAGAAGSRRQDRPTARGRSRAP